jgi:16S rRNA processing protein RimM
MYLKIGTITKQVGLKGEVRVYSTTYFATKRYQKGNTIFLKVGDEYQKLTIRTYRKLDRNFDVISFEEYPNSDVTIDLLKKDLFALKDDSILNKNEYYYSDLENCKIFSTENIEIGSVKSVEEMPAQLTLRCIAKNGKEFFVPFIPAFIKAIDIKNKKITIEVIEGLL